MLATEFIREKKQGLPHSTEHIRAFIEAYVRDEIPDYQVSAWLMAVCLNGMDELEAVALTQAMVNSGKQLEWGSQKFLPCDKHSTGGIGDKTSLIIAPLVASFGIPVPMMAGRGLGFTGGTLDKLESIPGFQTRIPLSKLHKQMEDIGFFLVGQTEEICPADKRMYSLRDVTCTVESLPLICASILSKKIAEGAKALVMDVKHGSGAFMTSYEDAHALAEALIKIGRTGGLHVKAFLTDMNQPLGRFVGNALEVKECLEILKGENPDGDFKNYDETRDLSIELSAQMLLLSGYNDDIRSCRKECIDRLNDGTAYTYFEKLISAQGGSLKKFQTQTKGIVDINASANGYLNFISNKHIGLSALVLGGGRQKSSDVLDPQVGIEVLRRQGDKMSAGEPLFRIYFNDQKKLALALEQIKHAYEISEAPPKTYSLIEELK